MRASHAVRLLAAVLAFSATGCQTLAPNLFGEKRTQPTIRINVTNLNFQDATLHVIRNGERHRLGAVSGKASSSFTIEWRTAQAFQLEIDLLAGGRCTTRQIVLDPGAQVDFQIEVDIRRQVECSE